MTMLWMSIASTWISAGTFADVVVEPLVVLLASSPQISETVKLLRGEGDVVDEAGRICLRDSIRLGATWS